MITPMLAALIGLSSTLGAPSTTATSTARSELRLRTGAELTTADRDEPAYDIDTTGSLGVAFDWKRVRLAASYAPRFVLSDLGGPEAARDFVQGLDLLLGLQSRSYALTLTHHLEYGERRFTALDAADIDPVTRRPLASPVPGSDSVLYAASVTQLALRLLLTARSELGITAGYGLNGGVDEESQRTLPLMAGPRLDAMWTYGLSRRDTLGLGVTSSWVRSLGAVTSGSVDSGVVGVGVRWDRTWPHELRSSLSAGAGLLIDRRRDVKPLPQGFATLSRAFVAGPNRGALDLSLGGGTATEADPLTGTTRPSARATGQVAWTSYPFRTYVLGAALKTLEFGGAGPQEDAATMYTADVGASYYLLKPLALEVGVRMNQQDVNSPTTAAARAAANGFSFAAFVAIAWRPEPFAL